MKTFISCMLVLSISYITNAQNVNIPDTAFLYALIDEGVDTNTDSLISYSEAEAINSLNVSSMGISDMTGIEAFTNLDTLNCSINELDSLNVSGCTDLIMLGCVRNNLASLDVSNNTALTYLECWDNQLVSLDVSNNAALTILLCFCNRLTNLDVTSCTALKYFNCTSNQLTNLNVSNNSTLEKLYCVENQLTILDVSNNTALTDLDCGDNQLISLDISNNTALKDMSCYENQLTNLNVTNNTDLNRLNCRYNQLTSLDVSNNTDLYMMVIEFMPTLYEVCVWTWPFPPAGVDVDTTGSPNVYFTDDCVVNIPGDYKENNLIDIYPNPSDDIINIEIENPYNATIEIYNVSGRLVFSKALNSKSERIDISGLSKWIYFVKVKQKHNVSTQKLIVY